MAEFVPVGEAKARLSELVRASDEVDVVLMKHGSPAAVVLSARRWQASLSSWRHSLSPQEVVMARKRDIEMSF